MDDYGCDCVERDEESRLRIGVHIEPFELKGEKVSIRTNVVSEKPRLEITTILERLKRYDGKRNPVFVYEKSDDNERLEIHNIGGIHPNGVHYLADQIYWVNHEDITIIPPRKCNNFKIASLQRLI
jgi:hypothetical protein